MDGFERKILVDGWVQEQKLAKKFVDGSVWAENFGRWMGGSAKPQIEHMYPPKYQVPPGINQGYKKIWQFHFLSY